MENREKEVYNWSVSTGRAFALTGIIISLIVGIRIFFLGLKRRRDAKNEKQEDLKEKIEFESFLLLLISFIIPILALVWWELTKENNVFASINSLSILAV